MTKLLKYLIAISTLIIVLLIAFMYQWQQPIIAITSDNIVFLGDSITESYDFNKYFPNQNIINSGIWGDTTDKVLIRIDTDVINYDPSKIFILIGINDIGLNMTNDLITKNIEKLILKIEQNCPYAKIYILSVYPLNISDFSPWYPPMDTDINNVVDDLNRKLIKLTNDLDVVYIDVAKHLKNDNNELIKEYTVEGIHITSLGYEIITEVLERYVK